MGSGARDRRGLVSDAPQTLADSVRYFSDAERALAAVVEMRWPNGLRCRACHGADVRFRANLRVWQCRDKHPRNQFSAKVGTIFEDSPLDFSKWLVAIWSVANCREGVSSYELARVIGVTQKTAWRMLHRIRLAMQTSSFGRLDGGIEADAIHDPNAKLEQFNRLTRRLLGVTRDEVADLERRFRSAPSMRQKPGRRARASAAAR
jgi:hypothetical protein